MKLFFLNSREVYTGYSCAEADRVAQALKDAGIRYKQRVSSRGLSLRGRGGGFGMNESFTRQYTVLVHEDDYDRAAHLARSAVRG